MLAYKRILATCIPHTSHHSTESGLLISTLNIDQVRNSIFAVELNSRLPLQARLSLVKPTSLDARDVGHQVQLGVQARPAVGAEEVSVVLARVPSDVVELGLT